MVAHVLLKDALIALWCLAAAVGCAKVTPEAANDAAKDTAIAAEAATEILAAEVAAAPAVQVQAETPEPARLASVAADAKQDAIEDPPAATEVQLRPPPSVPTPDLPPAAREQPMLVSAASATGEQERWAGLVASSPARPRGADTLDVTSLLSRLRKTKAINWRAKLAVKNESDDLLERFRDYHAQHGTATLSELRRSYDTLFRKLYSLLEAADPPLAREIDRSRAAIWAILADPVKFESSAPNRGMPQA